MGMMEVSASLFGHFKTYWGWLSDSGIQTRTNDESLATTSSVLMRKVRPKRLTPVLEHGSYRGPVYWAELSGMITNHGTSS